MQRQQLTATYQRTLSRLEKNIRSGRFYSFATRKKWQIWNRLCRYARQLGIKIKAPVATACLAAGLSFNSPATAQTFVEQTGTANPFNGVDVGDFSAPAFVDIDGDGDLDVFIGSYSDSTIHYYKNTGTASASVFAEQTGGTNPFNGVSFFNFSPPAFVDIDSDGDIDAFIGNYDGTVSYYKNIGTLTAPVFAMQAGAANPLNGVDVSYAAAPAFVDIDGDGDMDAFVGENDGIIHYYKNTGTVASAVFTAQTGIANPFNGVRVGDSYSAPTFVDVDADGDMDAFIAGYDYDNYSSDISYYKNTGTVSAPVFTLQSGPNDPLGGISFAYYPIPAFGDIDADGDKDVIIGANGTISYYQNTSALPLQLLSFSGTRQAGYNQLQWQTTSEINTKQFELEVSSDGRNFTKVSTINATGTTDNNYSIKDQGFYSGKIFYRIKMVDADGRFTYSQVIWIKADLTAGVVIYPNPVADILNINIGNAKLLKTIAGVYDGNGRLMQNILIKHNQQQINVQPFIRGRYVIKFADGSVQNFIKK